MVVDNPVYDLGSLVRPAHPVINPWNLETWLVAACVPVLDIVGVQTPEKLVQTLLGIFRSPDDVNKAGYIERHHPEIIRISGLPPVLARGLPGTVGIAGLQPSGLRVEKILPGLGPPRIVPVGKLVSAGMQGELPYGEVGCTIFQLLGCVPPALVLVLLQTGTLLDLLGLQPGDFRIVLHQLEYRERVVVPRPEGPGACYQGRGRVSLHDACLDIRHHPSGQGVPGLLREIPVRAHHRGGHIRVEHGKELYLRTVCIPVAE